MSAAELIADELACRRGGRLLFAHLSFRLSAGGALLLHGANGSGKSSLLRLLAGLLPPAAGRLGWGAAAIADDLPAHRARLDYLGHLDGINSALTVRETLAFWAALRGLSRRDDDRVAAEALAAFALDGVATSPCRGLSAGQRRRLALARLLIAPAELWLLDEPAGALDGDSRTRLEQAIAAHRAGGGRVVVATHVPLAVDAPVLDLEDFAPRPGEPGDDPL